MCRSLIAASFLGRRALSRLNATKLGGWRVDTDRRWSLMSRVVVLWSLDGVGVVACSFDDAWIGPVAAAFGASFVDFGQGFD